MVMTADIVDYQEWKTGKRTEGTQFAILSMSNKLSNALSVSLGILFIGAIGYDAAKYADVSHIGVQGSAENMQAIASYVTDGMQNKAWIIYFLLPGLCMLASSLLMFFYKIDEKTKTQMREELAVRRAENEAAQIVEEECDGNCSECEKDCDTRKDGVQEPFEEALAEHFEEEMNEVPDSQDDKDMEE